MKSSMPDNKASKGHDYRDTLFLPKTDFPMRAGLPKQEPQWLEHWNDIGLYSLLREESKGRPAFTLHDGPPYANGHLHMGTAFNKILKDIIIRSRQMMGFDANYVPGWDCHGLPIEWKVEEAFAAKGRKKAQVPAAEFRTACRAYAKEWIDVQREEFKRLGIEGDWENPYRTMDYNSQATVVGEFLKFVEKGLVYSGSKPVMWSPVEQTALAEAEIEYHDHQSTMIWVRFPFIEGHAPEGLERASVVIWTTTPWTIPGNRAVCYGPSLSYGAYRVDTVRDDMEFAPWSRPGEILILGDELADDVKKAGLVAEWTRIADVPTDMLKGKKLKHPLRTHENGYMFDVPLLAGDHVTDEAGTGFVHTAPSHGQEDYFVWLEHGLPLEDIPHTVGPDGAYTDEAPGFVGEKVIITEGKKKGKDGNANRVVIAQLVAHDNLFARGLLNHSYPHSWRSKAPVIFRNTPQWFIRMGAKDEDGTLRHTALKAIDDTTFYPPQGRKRLQSMVESRPDWLVSRQRAWGNPIAIFIDKDRQPLVDSEVNGRIVAAIRERGVDAWFDTPAEEFLGDKYDAADYEKVTDILDVWFDSGSTHSFVLEQREDLKWPADVYLEGSDQHRGWFQASLLEGCGTRGRAPFDSLITHGFVLDAKGYKMSKSLGNTILPEELTKKYGADIIRIWVASSDYVDDIRIGDEIIGNAVDAYRKLRNTLRYVLSALDGYADEEAVDYDDMPELERYILHRLQQVNGAVQRGLEAYDFKSAWRALFEFASVDLSSVYFDIRKDALYCDGKDSMRRRSARTVMAILFDYLAKWLAPICPFTAEESFITRYPAKRDEKGSVHRLTFDEPPADWRNDELGFKWDQVRSVRRVVTGALEVARRDKLIGSSLEASPVVHIDNQMLYNAVKGVDMAELAITSGARVEAGEGPPTAFHLHEVPGVAVAVLEAPGQKCGRCWKVLEEVSETTALCQRCDEVVNS
ncbi:isoleucine--tRNA ligase [Parvularcula sp. LCG005]|uniref:isoleucine--tRNA ligase n=1 Tax=Parvularcula sp. LCG005 TaxID=3078805 RepID=UPI002942A594|nr:isoleucine--tRNA ligase [Parvularcula sp. LCG005]WOI52820.1 isoleucine--tRNA ligase [Parvularcula sp. LCG005]